MEVNDQHSMCACGQDLSLKITLQAVILMLTGPFILPVFFPPWPMRRWLGSLRQHSASATAVVSDGRAFTYGELDRAAGAIAATLRTAHKLPANARIGVLAPPTFAFTSALAGAWRTGGIAVPLSLYQHGDELQYTLQVQPRFFLKKKSVNVVYD